jgi:hypothetical protein
MSYQINILSDNETIEKGLMCRPLEFTDSMMGSGDYTKDLRNKL